MLGFATYICLLVSSVPCIASSAAVATESPEVELQRNAPLFDPLSEAVCNEDYLVTFIKRGKKLIEADGVPTPDEIVGMLDRSPRQATCAVPKANRLESGQKHRTMVESSVLLGALYDCGACDELHVEMAGGVIVSQDGLVLTNHHVIDRNGSRVHGLVAMTYQGCMCPIVEVLASSESEDVALVRISSRQPLTAAAIATRRTQPGDPVSVLSHPHDQFFVLTTGTTSRYWQQSADPERVNWLEITAEFGVGSSGSGVFNADGELVGIVSRVLPLTRSAEGQDPTASSVTEMVLRRCVPLESMRRTFRE